jgi:hypothetical protein
MLSFRDVVVTPTAAIFQRPLPLEYQGGPIWPEFDSQREARHCRGPDCVPFDTQPEAAQGCDDRMAEAIWCGPVCTHFGHAIADFSMRIATSAQQSQDLPLLFASLPDGAAPPAFFWGIIDQFRVPRSRVTIVSAPVRVGTLHVLAQAERALGPPPEDGYLDLLDRITHVAPDPALRNATVFVSRSRYRADSLIGRLAAEAYLEAVLAEAGVLVVHPEELTVAEQLRLYRSVRQVIFSEGSALHGLQLLGRLPVRVAVIVRRPRFRMAAGVLAKRVRRVDWIDVIDGVLQGLRGDGRPDRGGGMSVLDEAALLQRLSFLHLDLVPHWNSVRYREACLDDANTWIRYHGFRARRLRLPEGDAAAVARSASAIRLFEPVQDRLALA